MDLKYWEKQLILYTKGHYPRTDYEKDLVHFPSEFYGLSLEQTYQYNVLHMVTDVYQKLVANGHIQFKLDTFITDIFKRAWWDNGKKEVSYDHILKHMLSEIQNIVILNSGIELGGVDENLYNIIKIDTINN
ncbi:hypothetical protein [Heyndrickxia camelliae]|uniref:Uncharacterized protein n=1 Tax=Heyndrickxia camelliae TaxID=1707093 RepID=A0A2N3LE35_9BACI|nr:hypothetical protein [Heyndrickxia camelliae]PKR82902.1 hypothetical protein CWO92_22185 [Heyndrickxia camelliae]